MEVGFRHLIEGTPTLDAAAARYITNHIKTFAGSSPVANYNNKGMRNQHERLMRPRAGAPSYLRGTVPRRDAVRSRSSQHQTGRNWALGVDSAEIVSSFRFSWARGCLGPRGCLKMEGGQDRHNATKKMDISHWDSNPGCEFAVTST